MCVPGEPAEVQDLHGHRADHYLIGPDGKVQKRWDRVKVDGHADEVLAALS